MSGQGKSEQSLPPGARGLPRRIYSGQEDDSVQVRDEMLARRVRSSALEFAQISSIEKFDSQIV